MEFDHDFPDPALAGDPRREGVARKDPLILSDQISDRPAPRMEFNHSRRQGAGLPQQFHDPPYHS